MGRYLKDDKKTWTFEPTEEVRGLVNAVIEGTGWSRTKVLNDVLGAYVQTYALSTIQDQKSSIQDMENRVLILTQAIQPAENKARAKGTSTKKRKS